MKIESKGIIVRLRKLQEKGLLATIFTKEHGLLCGYMSYGPKSRYTPGIIGKLSYSSRLSEHLGRIDFECELDYFAKVSHSSAKLTLFNLVLDSINIFLEEREPHPDVYSNLIEFLDVLKAEEDVISCVAQYIAYEYNLLRGIGYGLDFTKCAVSGAREDLSYISPNTGAVVSRQVGAPYKDKLIPIPRMFFELSYDNDDLLAALEVNRFIISKFAIMPNYKKFNSYDQLAKLIANC